MMPFENANRSPRWASWRGRKPSDAMSADRRGKSANAVFADRIRIDRGEELEHVVEDVVLAEHRAPHGRQDRLVLAQRRPELQAQRGDTAEQRGQDAAGPREHGGGVLRLGRAERGHAVRDRFDARQGDRARRERAHEQEQRDGAQQRAVVGDLVERLLVNRQRPEIAEHRSHQPVADEQGHDGDVAVGRRGEDPSRLAHAAQVGHRQPDQEHHGGAHPVVAQRGDGGRDGGRPRGDRDGDGQRVVDQQRRPGDQAGQDAEVVLADDVGAAAVGVGVDRLAVAEDHDGQQRHDQQ